MTGEEILEVDGLRIRVSLRGRGRPLLLLNGLGARLEVLDALRGELEDFETIAFDPPGIGESELPLWPMRLCSQARLVMRLLERPRHRDEDPKIPRSRGDRHSSGATRIPDPEGPGTVMSSCRRNSTG